MAGARALPAWSKVAILLQYQSALFPKPRGDAMTASAAASGCNRIVVVEDNDVTREGLAAILRQHGFEAVVASNGQEALDLLQAGPRPDLILLDMLMPVLDGWDFLKRVQQQGPQPPVPIIIATAIIQSREWVTNLGCQGLLYKPFETGQLLDEVRRCLTHRALRCAGRS
jgi:CheY-like chemotaxis protein